VLNIYKSSIQFGLYSLYLFTDNPREIIASYLVDNHPIISLCTFILTMAGSSDTVAAYVESFPNHKKPALITHHLPGHTIEKQMQNLCLSVQIGKSPQFEAGTGI
jgi:hypothetical protein